MTDPADTAAASALANHRWAMPNAREALTLRFERLVDPDSTLPADERTRRAAAAKTAHYRAVALRSAATRRAARAAASGSIDPQQGGTR